ncbi:MAG: hypothetical protein ABIA63_05985 [bacterium]
MPGAGTLLRARRAVYDAYVKAVQLEDKNAVESREYMACKALLEELEYRINYQVDKGWAAAVAHFADCISTGRPCKTCRGL